MGNCCSCRKKQKIDGDHYAPEILYFQTDAESSSPRKQPLPAPATDSVLRRRQALNDVTRAPLAQQDVYYGSGDYFAKRRRSSSTAADFLTRDHPHRDQILCTNTEPVMQDLCRDPGSENVSELKGSPMAAQSLTTRSMCRRSSLEPIILEDHLGESSQLWLGVQHGESESEESSEQDAFSPESAGNIQIIKIREEQETSSYEMLERQETLRKEDFSVSRKSDQDSAAENPRFTSRIQVVSDDSRRLRENLLALTTTDDNTLVRGNGNADPTRPTNPLSWSTDIVNLKRSSISREDLSPVRESPFVACVSSVADPVTRMRYLVTAAMRKGLLDYETAAQLLEGQIQAGGIVCITPSLVENAPSLHLVSVEEGLSRDLIDPKMYARLRGFESKVKLLFDRACVGNSIEAQFRYDPNFDDDRRMIQLQSNVGGLFDPRHNDIVPLSVGVRRRLIEENLAQEVLNQQIVSGGVVRGFPSLSRLPLESAREIGLIGEEAASNLRHFENLFHGVRDPRTQEPTTYAMCVRRGILTRHDVVDFLTRQALAHGGWVRNCFTHEWLPITRAMHEGMVDVDMWKAVERAINQGKRDPALIHPLWLRPVSYFDLLKSAVPESGPLDHCRVVQAGNIYEGVYDPRHNQRITLCEALQRDLTDRWTAKRLLKAQMESGGLVDVKRGERIPVSEALSRKVIDFPMAVTLVQQDRNVDNQEIPTPDEQKDDDDREGETLEDLVEMGIVHPKDMLELLQADGYFKGIIDMRTGKNVDISSDAVKRLITKTTVLRVLGTDAQIKGVVDVATGDTLSVGMATRHGIIDRHTGMRILERQVASGGLLKPPSLNGDEHVTGPSQSRAVIRGIDDDEKLRIQDAIKIGIIDPVLGKKLLETEKARNFNVNEGGGGAFIPESDDDNQCNAVEKIVKDQLCALGGVLDPRTKEILPLPIAVSRCLVSQDLASKLGQRQVSSGSRFPVKEKVARTFASALTAISESEEDERTPSSSSDSDDATMVGSKTALLRARNLRERRESEFRHRRMSTIYEEDEEEAIEPATGKSLTLGALSRHAGVEVNTGSRVLEGLDPAGRILIHHTAEDSSPGDDVKCESLHIVDAFSRGLLSEPVAFRLLEAHLAQGGIPDPTTGQRVSPTEALRRGYITQEMADKLIEALKNLLQERAQMFVFRLNELLCWCTGMEAEIHEYNMATESEKSILKEKLLQDAEPELQVISGTITEVGAFIERDQGHLDPFAINELVVLASELQERAVGIEKSLRDDAKPLITDIRRPLIGRFDSVGSSDGSTATSSDVKFWNWEWALRLRACWASILTCLFHLVFSHFTLARSRYSVKQVPVKILALMTSPM